MRCRMHGHPRHSSSGDHSIDARAPGVEQVRLPPGSLAPARRGKVPSQQGPPRCSHSLSCPEFPCGDLLRPGPRVAAACVRTMTTAIPGASPGVLARRASPAGNALPIRRPGPRIGDRPEGTGGIVDTKVRCPHVPVVGAPGASSRRGEGAAPAGEWRMQTPRQVPADAFS